MLDKTKNHFHIDPKLIYQKIEPEFKPGKFVYLSETGIYKLAKATSEIESNVQGIIWEVFTDSFYLKTQFGPLSYRYPFGPEYFNKTVLGFVDEKSPNINIPGNIGDKIWLSYNKPGGMESFNPSSYSLLLGYKTDYGMVYRPEFVKCCPA